MIHFAGAGGLIRLVLRRDRVRLAIWILAIVGVVYAQAASIKGCPQPAALAEAARLVGDNAAFIAMAGPPLALETVGGRTAFEISAFAMVLSALMSLLLVSRHVRGDEEAGRAELLRSTVVGRHASVVAALAVALVANVVVGALVVLALVAIGLPLAGSLALAVGIAGVGLALYGVRPAAAPLAWGALAVCFVVGFLGPLLPLPAWVEKLSPFHHVPRLPAASFSPVPLAVLAAVAAAFTTAGGLLFRRRDIGF